MWLEVDLKCLSFLWCNTEVARTQICDLNPHIKEDHFAVICNRDELWIYENRS